MKPTHQKRAYCAECVQWDGMNTSEVLGLFEDATTWKEYLMIRYGDGIATLQIGWWVVTGENGVVKCYSDEVFRVKYEELHS